MIFLGHVVDLFSSANTANNTSIGTCIYWQTNVSIKLLLPLLKEDPYLTLTLPDRHGQLRDPYKVVQKCVMSLVNQSKEWPSSNVFYNMVYPYLLLEIVHNARTGMSVLNLVLYADLLVEHFLEGSLHPATFYAPILTRYVNTFQKDLSSLGNVNNTVVPSCLHTSNNDGSPSLLMAVTKYPSVPLFPHQAEGLQWLLHMEYQIDQGLPVGYLNSWVPFPSPSDQGVSWDPLSFSLKVGEEGTKIPLYSLGGMVGDGIGSGKTLLMLSLIVNDMGTVCTNVPQAAQAQKRSRATLVLCGKQLATQWQEQVKKHFSHLSLKVVLLTDKLHHERVTLEEILTADLVIVTMSFLCGSYYREQFLKQRIFPDIAPLSVYRGFLLANNVQCVVLEQIHFRRLILDEADMYLHKLPYADPEVEHQYQRRLSQHCRVNSSRKTEPFIYTQCLQADFRWIVTSTANFSDPSQQAAFVSFLGLSTGSPSSLPLSIMGASSLQTPRTFQPLQPLSLDLALVGPSALERILVKDAFSNHLLLARSQQHVFASMALPPLDVDVIWIEYSDAERNLVRGALEMHTDYNFRRHVHAFPLQLLMAHGPESGLGAGRAMSIQEASEVMLGTQRQRLLELEASVQQARTNLEEVEKVRQTATEVLVNVLNHRHLQLSNEVKTAEATMAAIHRSMSFLEASLNSKDPCSICMDAVTSVITKCGHKFCSVCLERCLRDRPRCPTCRAPCVPEQCIPLHPAVPSTGPEGPEAQQDYGSRFRALLTYLQGVKAVDPGAQFVVFSEWAQELQKQAILLLAQGFRCAEIKGNTSVCQNNVRQFQEGSLNVLFLSLQSMASGLHLANANYVIILTPLGAPFDRAEQIERQAIGRCHRIGQTKTVHVRHLLVRNSMEEEIWDLRRQQTQRNGNDVEQKI